MGVLRAKVDGSWVDLATTGPQGPMGYVGRNLLDNGQKAIKQRAAASVSLGTATFLADRWSVSNSGIGAATLTYATLAGFGATGIPVGRPRPANIQYLIMNTAEAAGSLTPGDYMQWSQGIEGQFLQHLNWGSPDAQPLTYSFDIYSNIATNYVVELYRLESTARTISRLLTVPAGWSTQIVSFPGDTVNTITNDNANRLLVTVAIASGSNYTSGGVLQTTWGNIVTGNRWVGLSNAIQATINNVFAITNAQLEIGSQATPYEVRPYDVEMRNCQRYFYESLKGQYSTIPSAGVITVAATAYLQVFLPVRMRATPVPSYIGALRLIDQFGATGFNITALVDTGSGQSNADVLYLTATIAGGTGGRYVALQCNNDANAAFRANAEI